MSASDDLMPIDEVARRLGMRVSALRYYDERRLVTPADRRGGRRWYGPTEMRQLAVVRIAHDIGFPLEVARSLLHDPRERWEPAVRAQVSELELLVARARAALSFLTHVLDCDHDRPPATCATLGPALDEVAAGLAPEELARRHAGVDLPRAHDAGPPAPPR